MKIKYKEIEIEADAKELRESQTLAQNFSSLLSRCFASTEPFDDEEGESDERAERKDDDEDGKEI